MDTLDELVFCKLFTREIFFHQFLVGLCNCLTDSGNKTVKSVTEIGHCNLGSNTVIIGISLHIEKVYVAGNLVIFNKRNNDRTNRRTKVCFQFFEYLIEIRVLGIHLADKNHSSFVVFDSEVIRLLRTDCYTRFTRNGNEYAVTRLDTLTHLTREIEQTGSVDEVDFIISPLKRSNCTGN